MRIGDVYTTTFRHAYRPRARTIPAAPIHKRAPGNWKVHYTMHTIEKVSRSLVRGEINQHSKIAVFAVSEHAS